MRLLVQYSTDDANWKTLTTYETVKDPDTQKPITIDHPVILHVYGVNEQDVSTANATLSGLPLYDLNGNFIQFIFCIYSRIDQLIDADGTLFFHAERYGPGGRFCRAFRYPEFDHGEFTGHFCTC